MRFNVSLSLAAFACVAGGLVVTSPAVSTALIIIGIMLATIAIFGTVVHEWWERRPLRFRAIQAQPIGQPHKLPPQDGPVESDR